MSLNKEAEAFGTTTSQTPPPPTYPYPPPGGNPIQPTFTGNGQTQFASGQNMQFTPIAPMSQLPPMQNATIGMSHPTMTQSNVVPPLGIHGIQQTVTGFGTTPLQPGMAAPMQPRLGSPQFIPPQQTGVGLVGIQGVQGVQAMGQPGHTLNTNLVQGQATYVPYPVVVQQQPPAGPTAVQIGEQFMAQQYALCAAGNHDRSKKFGIFGIICAIVFFPIGFICLFMDQEETCVRCGRRL